jgi:hypothetical protein
MHIIAIFLAIIVIGAIWYRRLKAVSYMAQDIGRMASNAKGAIRRKRFLKRAEQATLASVDDPRTAAAIIMISAIESGRPMTDDDERAVQTWLETVAEDEKASETVIFSRWAARQGHDFNATVKLLSPLLKKTLGPDERQQLVEAVGAIVSRRGTPTTEQESSVAFLQNDFRMPARA